ncbi:hypothetical protein [Streptomyces sp. NBC_00286]|uniref:hypothetical protein n=1 Tax=Streptomyces sp. NBC_00286 TaxID=2975701 RepID=UPI002E2E6469|nr:hypothetical protein [Streptomyces sp. NBC_00286]
MWYFAVRRAPHGIAGAPAAAWPVLGGAGLVVGAGVVTGVGPGSFVSAGRLGMLEG